MLIQVSLENFKSFDERAELTMISSSKISKKKEHRVQIKGTQILKYGVIYGANASGKSNFVDFFRFFKECVRKGLPLESVEWFCKNRKENKERGSNFEVQFSIGQKCYAYGFSALLSERKIVSEWLYELHQNGNGKLLFEREEGERPVLGESLTMSAEEKRRFEVYAEDFEDNRQSLFLTEMNRGKKYPEDSRLLFFQNVYGWFANHLYIIRPNTPLMNLEYYYEEGSLDLINRVIRTFDTGISEVKVENISFEEIENELPKQFFDSLMKKILSEREENPDRKYQVTMRSNNSFFNISFNGNEEPVVTTIRLHHGKSFFDFRFEDESDGTRRLFDLIDILLNPRDDVTYIVDELERSLHPKLTEHFLREFMILHKDRQKQLLFTTHESYIMDQSLFRRDEVWFVERDEANASRIYSLDRFNERYDKVLKKAYLEGRYGAVPVFSSFCNKKEE